MEPDHFILLQRIVLTVLFYLGINWILYQVGTSEWVRSGMAAVVRRMPVGTELTLREDDAIRLFISTLPIEPAPDAGEGAVEVKPICRIVRPEPETTPAEVTAPGSRMPTREERKRAYQERKSISEEAPEESVEVKETTNEPVTEEEAEETSDEQERGGQLYLNLPAPEGVDDPVISAVVRIIIVRVFVRPTQSGAFGGGRTITDTSAWRLSQAQVHQAGGDRRSFKKALGWLFKERVVEETGYGAIRLCSVDEAKPAGATLLRAAQVLKLSRGAKAPRNGMEVA